MSMLRGTIETGRADGMHLMDLSLRDLYQQGIITYDTAMSHAHTPEMIQQHSTPAAPRRA